IRRARLFRLCVPGEGYNGPDLVRGAHRALQRAGSGHAHRRELHDERAPARSCSSGKRTVGELGEAGFAGFLAFGYRRSKTKPETRRERRNKSEETEDLSEAVS